MFPVAYMLTKDTIYTTVTASYGIIRFLREKSEYFQDTLEDLDVEFKIQVFERFIKNNNAESNDAAVIGVHRIIEKVNQNLENINEQHILYKNSWFRYFYRFDCSKELNQLKKNINILTSRFDLLTKTTKNFIVINNDPKKAPKRIEDDEVYQRTKYYGTIRDLPSK